ncbi:MAG: hypothetical protein JST79_17800 [Acidobacteria bacterium]|nr:hypothetical protein [Acidobacteriota bacterium]
MRNPKEGKWIVAVNAAPSMTGHGQFVVDEFIGAKPVRQPLTAGVKNEAELRATVDLPATPAGGVSPTAFLCEFVDAALERAQLERLGAVPPMPGEKKEPPVVTPIAVAAKTLSVQ